VVKYIDQRPEKEKMQFDFDYFAVLALQEAWPCKSSPDKQQPYAVFSDRFKGRGNMRTLIVGASILLALLTGSAWANDTDSANRLLPACEQFNELPPPSVTFVMAYDEGKCVGIILGVVEAADDVCIADGVTVDQKVLVAIQYIEQRPQRMHEQFAKLAHEALKAAWPCKP
jgi:hypothetical protein